MFTYVHVCMYTCTTRTHTHANARTHTQTRERTRKTCAHTHTIHTHPVTGRDSFLRDTTRDVPSFMCDLIHMCVFNWHTQRVARVEKASAGERRGWGVGLRRGSDGGGVEEDKHDSFADMYHCVI